MATKRSLNRRDFLKLSGIALGGGLSAGLNLPTITPKAGAFQNLQPNRTKPNIIVVLFDALSARHLSLYNYRRKTSPNIERFAQRAIVYNNHYSPGNFTSPSTGSFFTGSYPWIHRALHLNSQVRKDIAPFNIFRFLSPDYYECAFTQSTVADTLLYQLGETLDEHRRLDSYSLAGHALYPYLENDEALNVSYAYDGFQLKNKSQSGSLFLALLRDLSIQMKYQLQAQKYRSLYPLVDVAKLGGPETSLFLPCLTGTDVYYALYQLFDGLMRLFDEVAMSAAKAAKPFLAYIHVKPPHAPYMPDARFLGSFNDGWAPKPKPDSRLLGSYIPQQQLNGERQRYDEFIANLDAEFGRLLDHLEESGRLDDSILMVTSDHGETFERGEDGHSTPNVYEQLIHIPLLISVPGQKSRYDVTALTSTVDIVPTMLKVAGVGAAQDAPLEGQVLPGFENWSPTSGSTSDEMASKSIAADAITDADRSVFVVEGKSCPLNRRIQGDMATTAIVKGHYKLVHYTHYLKARDRYEFYDLQNDPAELENLYKTNPIAKDYQTELEQALLQAEKRVFGNR
jgi:arylsulfatase A-like enzyme